MSSHTSQQIPRGLSPQDRRYPRHLDGTLDVMRNVDLEKAGQILRDAFRPARRTSVNTFLI
jgi:hypothetical protein